MSLKRENFSLLPACQSLVSIIIESSDLTNRHIQYFIPLLSKNLRELVLEKNNINSKGAEELAKSLKDSKLEVLSLEGNPIAARGVTNILKNLPVTLRELNLSSLTINYTGLEALRQHLKLGNLKVLNLANSELRGFPGNLYSCLLKENQLTHCQLFLYDLSNRQVGEIVEAAAKHPSLQELSLGNRGIHESELANALKLMYENTVFKKLQLRLIRQNSIRNVTLYLNSEKSSWRKMCLLLNKRNHSGSSFYFMHRDLTKILCELLFLSTKS